MARRRLPSRRPAVTRCLCWTGSDGRASEFTITIGFDPDTGAPAEVFCSGGKAGSTMQGLIEDTAVLLSILLQYGIAPTELAHSLGRIPTSATESSPSSLVGSVVEALIEASASEVGNPTTERRPGEGAAS